MGVGRTSKGRREKASPSCSSQTSVTDWADSIHTSPRWDGANPQHLKLSYDKRWGQDACEPATVFTYISGVLDLFLPLKNSGTARRSITWMLSQKKQGKIRVVQVQICSRTQMHTRKSRTLARTQLPSTERDPWLI